MKNYFFNVIIDVMYGISNSPYYLTDLILHGKLA